MCTGSKPVDVADCHLSAVKKDWEEVDLPLWLCLCLLQKGCNTMSAHSLVK